MLFPCRKIIAIISFSSFIFHFSSAHLSFAVYAADSLYFIHTDHLGSTTVITDEQGDIVSQDRYYPYGSERTGLSSTSDITERGYTSQIRDQESALYYYNARYYDPALGVFVSADPVNDSLNRFAYVGNNPVMVVDPSGHALNIGGRNDGGDAPIWDREIEFFNNWTASEIAEDFWQHQVKAFEEEDWLGDALGMGGILATGYVFNWANWKVAGWRVQRAASGARELALEAQPVVQVPSSAEIRDELLDYYRRRGVGINLVNTTHPERIPGKSAVGSRMVTLYPVDGNWEAGGLHPLYLRHEFGHALAEGGQVPAVPGTIEGYYDECIQCRATYNWFLARGFSPDHPWLRLELEYWQQNYEAILGLIGLQ